MKITELTKEISGLNNTIYDKNNELFARNEKIKENNIYIEKLTKQASEKNAEISIIRQECNQLHYEIRNSLKPELEEKKAQVAEMGCDQLDKKAKLAKLESELAEKNKEVGNLSSRVSEQGNNLHEIQASLMNSKMDSDYKANHLTTQIHLIKKEKVNFEEKCKKLNTVILIFFFY